MSDKPNTNPANIPDEDDDMEDLRVTLTLEDNLEVECKILTIFDLEDQNYIVLMPEEDEDEDETEVFIYRYFEDEDGNPSLDDIKDDDEYEAVTDRFEELLDEAEWEELDD